MEIEEIINIDNTIPVGWEVVSLDDLVLKIFAGGDKPDEVSNEKTEEFSYPIFSNGLKDKGLYGYSNAYRVDEECITISARGTIGYTEVRTPKFTPIVRLIVIVPTEYTLSKYLKFYFENLIVEKSGTSIPQLTVPMIKPIPIKLPPLNEQKRIITKIEKLFSNLDNSDKYLLHLEKQLKRYRQSVLKSAFEGKLTKEWSEKQTNLETADELLQKIKKDREKYYLDLLFIWKEDSKKWEKGLLQNKPKKPKKLADFEILSQEELDELPTLSNSWKWTKIDSLLAYEENSIKAGPFGSSLKKSCYTESGFKIYGQEQVIANDPFLGNYYVGKDKYRELFSCRIKADDILISLVGTIGKVLILPKNCEQGIINPRLIKISLHEKNYSAKFFKFYFESSFLKSLYAISSHGATMDIINMGIIKDLPFPLCSLEEQIEVVSEIEKHFSIIDKLEVVVQQSIKESKRLRQSILKQAFEGKLVEQDPNDESASILLEKIAKAKEEYQKAQKKQVRKK